MGEWVQMQTDGDTQEMMHHAKVKALSEIQRQRYQMEMIAANVAREENEEKKHSMRQKQEKHDGRMRQSMIEMHERYKRLAALKSRQEILQLEIS